MVDGTGGRWLILLLPANPIIGAAGLLEVPKLLHQHTGQLGLVALSGLVAGVSAFISVAVPMRYFHRTEFGALNPFAYSCVGAGAISLILLTLVIT